MCANGYQGANCEIEFDICESNPCQNEGICMDVIGRYLCDCRVGYTGLNCETCKYADTFHIVCIYS